MNPPSRIIAVGDELTYPEAAQLPDGSVVYCRGAAYRRVLDRAGRQDWWKSEEIADVRYGGAYGLSFLLLWEETSSDRLFLVSRIGPERPFTAPPEGRAAPPVEQLARLVLDALGRDLHFIDGMYVTTLRNPK